MMIPKAIKHWAMQADAWRFIYQGRPMIRSMPKESKRSRILNQIREIMQKHRNLVKIHMSNTFGCPVPTYHFPLYLIFSSFLTFWTHCLMATAAREAAGMIQLLVLVHCYIIYHPYIYIYIGK